MAGKITATDAARKCSKLLNQVRYQGVEFDIVRGKEVVARLVPAAPPGDVALDLLDELARSLPRLGPHEAERFALASRAGWPECVRTPSNGIAH